MHSVRQNVKVVKYPDRGKVTFLQAASEGSRPAGTEVIEVTTASIGVERTVEGEMAGARLERLERLVAGGYGEQSEPQASDHRFPDPNWD